MAWSEEARRRSAEVRRLKAQSTVKVMDATSGFSTSVSRSELARQLRHSRMLLRERQMPPGYKKSLKAQFGNQRYAARASNFNIRSSMKGTNIFGTGTKTSSTGSVGRDVTPRNAKEHRRMNAADRAAKVNLFSLVTHINGKPIKGK